MTEIRSNKSHSGTSIQILIKALRIGWDRETLESVLILFINETCSVEKSSTKSNTQLHKSFLLELNFMSIMQ